MGTFIQPKLTIHSEDLLEALAANEEALLELGKGILEQLCVAGYGDSVAAWLRERDTWPAVDGWINSCHAERVWYGLEFVGNGVPGNRQIITIEALMAAGETLGAPQTSQINSAAARQLLEQQGACLAKNWAWAADQESARAFADKVRAWSPEDDPDEALRMARLAKRFDLLAAEMAKAGIP